MARLRAVADVQGDGAEQDVHANHFGVSKESIQKIQQKVAEGLDSAKDTDPPAHAIKYTAF
jgi:transposase